MKNFIKYFLYAGFLFLNITAKAQVDINSMWTWIKGDSTINHIGIYGTQTIPSSTGKPGGRYNSVGWKDASDNLWLFGGSSGDYTNELWKYNTSLNEWTWIQGDTLDATSDYSIYGSQGIAANANHPGGRYYSNTWTDNVGNMWLFGGAGYANAGNSGNLNDLWKYDVEIKAWAWMNGGNSIDNAGVYGIQNVAAASNQPGARDAGVSWKDRSGNLWLFGGTGVGENGLYGYQDDLWKYDMSSGQWVWVNGDKIAGSFGVYGTQGIASINNRPGARAAAVGWKDHSGNFWISGGSGYDENGNLNELNDLWKYDPLLNQWTWMKGDKTGNKNGIYGALGVPADLNEPGARVAASASTDSSGNFYLFGGIGYTKSGNGSLNDLWKYSPLTNQWVWIKGDSTADIHGIYGSPGTASGLNKPGSRFGNTSWADNAGNFYLFGGTGYAASGIPGYLNDLWKISVGPTVLAVTLLNFSAVSIQKNVLLSWQTTNEINMSVYNIEHSRDGTRFSLLGSQAAVGNGPLTKNYSFTDYTPWAASNFYRLKMIQADGKFSYSKVVAVNGSPKNNFKVFPNPANAILYIYAGDINENAMIEIFDGAGGKVIEEIISGRGNVYLSLNIAQLPKGTYHLILKKKETTDQQEFVKQ